MGIVIPSGFALGSWHTTTTGDLEEMIWTCGVDIGSASDPTQLPKALSDAWNAHLKTLTSSVVTLQRTVAKLGPTSTGPTYEFAAGIVGTNGGSLPPPNCCVLGQKHSTLGGRKGRGRAYFPGLSNISGSLNSAGVFGSVAQGDVQTAINGMQADINGSGNGGPYEFVLLHSDATAPSTILNWTVSNKLATQRRRLRP